MRKSRIMGILLASLFVFGVGITGVKGCAAQTNDTVVVTATEGNQPMATDVIIKKYRVHNGRTQYRRWNDTKQCWVDPYWIDV